MSGGMRQGEQAKCPYCGVPLTGMNSNPDDCLQKPSEPAPSEEVFDIYGHGFPQVLIDAWERREREHASALRAERERVRQEIRLATLKEAAEACNSPKEYLGQVSETRRQAWTECVQAVCALAKKGLST